MASIDYSFLLYYSQERPGSGKAPMPVKRLKITCHGDSFKRALFEDSTQVVRQSTGSSQKTTNVATGSSSKAIKDMTDVEWALNYNESERILVVLVGKNSGRGVMETGRVFPYGKALRVDYLDEDSNNIQVHVETSKGERFIMLSEDWLVLRSCKPVELQKILKEADNIIVALRPFITGEAAFEDSEDIFSQDNDVETGVRRSPVPVPQRKRTARPRQRVQNKPIKKSRRDESTSAESDDSDGVLDKELVTPGGELSSGIVASEQNTIRRQIIKSKLVKRGHIFTLPITLVNRPPLDPVSGRRPLEIREPHNLHVQNLKKKMKINPHATVVPFLVMVDPQQCAAINDFDISNPEKYQYFVIGGSHSAEARRQLVQEHPTTYFFKYAECKIYVGLTVDEAKLLAWDHNNDNDYRQKMSSIERIRFFHYEYLDALRSFGQRLHPGLRRQCLNEVGIVIDDTVKSDGLRKYEPWFQLAFRDGIVWDLQDKIFTMWEAKEVKGQKVKKGKVDPHVEVKGTKGKKTDYTIEEAAEDMKLTPWRALQGIKDETLLVSVLSRVISKELSLDEMVVELSKLVFQFCYLLYT